MKNIRKKISALKPVFDRITPSLLTAMPYEFPGKDIELVIATEEFTCLCPWSGLPDFAVATIQYVPAATVIELKSLKYYLHSFRMVGIVHESAVNRMCEDLAAAVRPKHLTVELEFKIRGGIGTTVRREYHSK